MLGYSANIHATPSERDLTARVSEASRRAWKDEYDRDIARRRERAGKLRAIERAQDILRVQEPGCYRFFLAIAPLRVNVSFTLYSRRTPTRYGGSLKPLYLFSGHLAHFSKSQLGFAQISTGTIWHARAVMDRFCSFFRSLGVVGKGTVNTAPPSCQ